MQADQDRHDGHGEYSRDRDFARLADHFESMRVLPALQRDVALADLAVAEPGLTTALRLLFAQHDDDPEALASPERAFDPDLIGEAVAAAGTDVPLPTAIGPYRPLRELGRGGMGTVYLAEREHADFRQLVAVKLLRAAGDDQDLRRRFRTERRILAALQHPNIAAMFDGGSTGDGQPFVVMEYVDGPDLLTYCEQRRAKVADRVRLFVKVCRAVAHAHRSLVVHRDLKPGNVLVTAEGEPKLLDFGIAKLLQRDDTEATLAVTHTGSMLLTPEYSSPEQVRGEAITTATDVYALGTILYELLSGQRAQPLQNRSLAELLRVVCERTPPPPSRAVIDAGARIPGHAEHRVRLERQLQGDLDTIVACALRKEPERRYGSATAFADDLERHLAGLPVAARGDSFAYRARTFVRRNRLALGTATLLLSMLVGFAIVTAAQNRQIARERDDAVTQRTTADQIVEFLVDLFAMAAPDPERAQALRASELLDRGARRIDRELAGAPARKAALQIAMGRAYVSLGLYDRARPLLEAAERALAASGPDSSDHRTAQFSLGVLCMHQAATETGERLLRASLQPAADGRAPDQMDVALRTLTLATWLREAGRFDEATQLLDRAAALADTRAGELRSDGVDLPIARAAVLRDRGDCKAALAMLQQALQRATERDGGDHPRHAFLYRELGLTHKEIGNLDEAREALQHALQLDRAVSGEDHPDVDGDLFSLAMLEIDLGDLHRAETLLREILARDEARFGPRHPYPALVRGQLARVIGNLDRAEQAEALFLEALALQRELLPDDHPELATTLANLGTFYQRHGRVDEAAPLFAEALERRVKIFPEDHPTVLTSRNQMAVLEHDRGRFAEAEQQFRAILEARRRVLGSHEETAGSLLSVATAVARQNRDAEAIPLFEESLAMFRATLPPTHPTLARPLLGLGLAHMRLKHPELAEPYAREAVSIDVAALGEPHPETCHAQWVLARCIAQAGRTQEAMVAMRALLGNLTQAHPDHPLVAQVREGLAVLLERTGDQAGAAELRK